MEEVHDPLGVGAGEPAGQAVVPCEVLDTLRYRVDKTHTEDEIRKALWNLYAYTDQHADGNANTTLIPKVKRSGMPAAFWLTFEVHVAIYALANHGQAVGPEFLIAYIDIKSSGQRGCIGFPCAGQ